MLATRVWVERPGEAHVLDRVESGLALHLEIVDVGKARLWSSHSPMIEQTFGSLACEFDVRTRRLADRASSPQPAVRTRQRRRAKVVQDAFLAPRPAGGTDPAAAQDHPHPEACPFLFRHHPGDLQTHLQR